jgi:hypothetical protein
MKSNQLVLLLALMCLTWSCKSPGSAAANPTAGKVVYSYQSSTGKCQDASGKPGLNKVDVDKVRSSKNCECADLTGIDLVDLLPGITEANRFAYNELNGYNFRGADLSKAKIIFNNLEKCDFSGANLTGFSYGYSTIGGTVDQYTRLPGGGCDEVKDGVLNCRQ